MARKVVITISIDSGLLDQVDEICEINRLTRSQMITDAVQEKLDYINGTIAEERNEKENDHGC